MYDIVRDATIGQIINRLSNGKFLPYEDQKPGYTVPARYLVATPPLNRTETDADTLVGLKTSSGGDVEKASASEEPATPAKYPYLVEFDENDQDRPQ